MSVVYTAFARFSKSVFFMDFFDPHIIQNARNVEEQRCNTSRLRWTKRITVNPGCLS